jgi:hypothetical protein
MERKRGMKWYMKLMRCSLNIAVCSACVICSKTNSSNHLSYKLDLMKALVLTIESGFWKGMSLKRSLQHRERQNCKKTVYGVLQEGK